FNFAYNFIASKINYASYQAHAALTEHLLLNLTMILFLGALAQWLAWRYRFPSIAFLLLFGFMAGPIGRFIDPDKLFGKTFIPIVSLSVAFILFEGALSLKFSEVVSTRKVVRNLVTLGALITLVLSAAASYYILKLDIWLSLLFAAILTVTGPTVILPLLRHIKPVSKVSSVLKWEGIVVDPIGAILAVLVYQAMITGEFESSHIFILKHFLKIVSAGFLAGALGAAFFYTLLKNYLVPEFLQNPFTLALVACVFTGSNILMEESGLLAITVMGIMLANQKKVDVKNILVFKENLRVLLISILFILLSSRLRIRDFEYLNAGSLIFMALLIFAIRPACVFASAFKSDLNFREKLFISFMAPRGIIAASVSSVFALNLVEAGHKNAAMLVPLTFMVIVITVLFYSIVSPWLARRLGISNTDPQAVIIIGAQPPVIKVALALKDAGIQTLLLDNNPRRIDDAVALGLTAYASSIMADNIIDEIEISSYSKVLAMTSNDKVNSLAVIRFAEHFEKNEMFQIASKLNTAIPRSLTGRQLFRENLSYLAFEEFFNQGALPVNIPVNSEFAIEEFEKKYGKEAMVLFFIDIQNRLTVNCPDNPGAFRQRKLKSIIALVAGDKSSPRQIQA
ncbi:MAG TPA: sodium:proton antiporter, partial [Candidatus Wallbacteria bacterium]|nr:sodium:proton antiporter [Candidatus Wallbacteria bacterium]